MELDEKTLKTFYASAQGLICSFGNHIKVNSFFLNLLYTLNITLQSDVHQKLYRVSSYQKHTQLKNICPYMYHTDVFAVHLFIRNVNFFFKHQHKKREKKKYVQVGSSVTGVVEVQVDEEDR